ncbi:unnamed protein product [Merluccius merluccius]
MVTCRFTGDHRRPGQQAGQGRREEGGAQHGPELGKAERVRLWEVSVVDRHSLIEPFVYLASKMTQPQSKSTFPLSRNKNKSSGSVDS